MDDALAVVTNEPSTDRFAGSVADWPAYGLGPLREFGRRAATRLPVRRPGGS